MNLDVLVQSLAVVLAASIPSAFGLLRMRRTALSIEEIRQQLLPQNGKRLAALAYETQRDVADLRNQLIDLRFEFKEMKGHTPHPYDSFGAASITATQRRKRSTKDG